MFGSECRAVKQGVLLVFDHTTGRFPDLATSGKSVWKVLRTFNLTTTVTCELMFAVEKCALRILQVL